MKNRLAEFFNTLLTLLGGVSNKWAEELAEFLAAARRTRDLPGFMLL
jgi:hypothetical protein